MARIYHKRGAMSVNTGGHKYEADADGGFEGLPGDVEAHLLAFPDWETDYQREARRVQEDLARRRDPASAFDELASLRTEIRHDLREASRDGQGDSRDEEIADLRRRLAELEGHTGHDHPADGQAKTGTEHPADGTMSPPVSNPAADDEPDPPAGKPKPTPRAPRARRPPAAK